MSNYLVKYKTNHNAPEDPNYQDSHYPWKEKECTNFKVISAESAECCALLFLGEQIGTVADEHKSPIFKEIGRVYGVVEFEIEEKKFSHTANSLAAQRYNKRIKELEKREEELEKREV